MVIYIYGLPIGRVGTVWDGEESMNMNYCLRHTFFLPYYGCDIDSCIVVCVQRIEVLKGGGVL